MKKINIFLLPNNSFITLKKNNSNYIYIYNKKYFFYFNTTNYLIEYKNTLKLLEIIAKQPILNVKHLTNILNNFIFS